MIWALVGFCTSIVHMSYTQSCFEACGSVSFAYDCLQSEGICLPVLSCPRLRIRRESEAASVHNSEYDHQQHW